MQCATTPPLTPQDSISTQCTNAKSPRPNVVILATGGTIAGVASSHTQSIDYKAGALGIEVLLDTLPELGALATLQWEQVANIDSADMTDSLWLTLAKRVNALLAQEHIDGVVITHGSDTMEESAFFLQLVVASPKPVVLTGAMRPSNAISADGAKNLYNAIALASHSNARNKGVMIVMNDRIQSARYGAKTHTHNLDALTSPNSGDMGYILDGRAHFYYTLPLHTTQRTFCVDTLTQLPKVAILYSYANDYSGVAARALYAAGIEGIIVAGSGAGSIHRAHKEVLQELMQQGLVVVVSTRVGCGIVQVGGVDSKRGFISARSLNPQKARALLLLALTRTRNPAEIAQIFGEY
ncbi:asparaginase [uncultured Helicobacter sp.]|uniref:asparaginase n=1 Tax=uncultured Helicobacter sp. TaxID=175537 RepID=UPI00374FED39